MIQSCLGLLNNVHTIYRAKCWLPFSNLHFHVIVAHDIAARMGRVHTCTNPTASTAWCINGIPWCLAYVLGSILVALLTLRRDFPGLWWLMLMAWPYRILAICIFDDLAQQKWFLHSKLGMWMKLKQFSISMVRSTLAHGDSPIWYPPFDYLINPHDQRACAGGLL